VARIVLEGVSKRYGHDVAAVSDLSLSIEDGELMVLVGPSGCGKSTVLRMLAGLEEPTGGDVYIGDRRVTELPPKDRDVAMVFQNYALYPHLSVQDNLAFGLKARNLPKPEIERRVVDVAKKLGLEPMLRRKPSALSGGQRQRVAMGRAIVREPLAFLMDEPLSNLDAKLRVQMRAEIARLHQRLSTTMVYVTHDQVEAMTLGDRVAVLRDGVLQQVDTPTALFARPDNLFVAAFIGSPSMNLVRARVAGGRVVFGSHALPLPPAAPAALREGSSVIFGVRPSAFEDAEVWDAKDQPVLEVRAEVVEELGSESHVLFTIDAPPVITEDTRAAADEAGADAVPTLPGEDRVIFTARVDARTAARPGSPVRLSVDPARFHFFEEGTGRALERSRPVGAVTGAP